MQINNRHRCYSSVGDPVLRFDVDTRLPGDCFVFVSLSWVFRSCYRPERAGARIE